MDKPSKYDFEGKLVSISFSVVHVITTIDLGGAEKQLLTLASAQSERGLKVEVIFLKDNPILLKQFLDSGISVNSSFSRSNFLSQVLRLRKRRNSEKIVFHAHLPRAELLCSMALKKGSFISTRHNSELFLPKGPKLISRILSRYVTHRAFALISISHAVETFLRETKEVRSDKKIVNIYYGLEDVRVKVTNSRPEKKYTFKIGTVARLTHQKNLPLLLESLKVLHDRGHRNFDLSIVGIGPLSEELLDLARGLKLSDALTWRGQIADVSQFYNSLDLFILTSRYEGFGLVLLEAMLEGIPIIANNNSSIPEVLGVNHPGLVNSSNPKDFAEKILQVCEDKRELDKYLLHQSKQLSNFSIRRTESAHFDLYNSLAVHNS